MKLPHIKNSAVAQNTAEAVFTNLYEMQLFPPDGIPYIDHLVDEIVSISGLDKIDELPEIKTQKSRGHTRIFSAPMLGDTQLTLDMSINLNAHGKNADQIVIYEMFKQWGRRQRDERTGAMGLKPDCVGSGQLAQFNKGGFVWRRIKLTKALLASVTGFDEAALANGDPVMLKVKLVIEEFELLDAGTV
jgi:hypothetical protein